MQIKKYIRPSTVVCNSYYANLFSVAGLSSFYYYCYGGF